MNATNRPQTGKQALQWAASFLMSQGFPREQAVREGYTLLAKACDQEKIRIVMGQPEVLEEQDWKVFRSLVQRRGAHQPLQYILGWQEFMGLSFRVSPAVLVPRWDTETLVQEVLRLSQTVTAPRVLELGTGSGAIALSIAYYHPTASVHTVDISPDALTVARDNARQLGVYERVVFYEGDLYQPLGHQEPFDFILSNPPYLSTSEMAEVPEDVRCEPDLALRGGADGLDFYRRIIPGAHTYLKAQGQLLLEIGWQQGQEVEMLLKMNGYQQIRMLHDMQHCPRVVVGQKS